MYEHLIANPEEYIFQVQQEVVLEPVLANIVRPVIELCSWCYPHLAAGSHPCCKKCAKDMLDNRRRKKAGLLLT